MSSLDKAAWALWEATDDVKGLRYTMAELHRVLEKIHEFIDAVDLDESREFLAFLAEHPELREGRSALSFTDEELLDALRAACDEWAEYYRENFPGREHAYGASSSCVARHLAGLSGPTWDRSEEPKELRPTDGEVIRVGQALARLVKAGRARQASRSWGARKWAPAEDRDDA